MCVCFVLSDDGSLKNLVLVSLSLSICLVASLSLSPFFSDGRFIQANVVSGIRCWLISLPFENIFKGKNRAV